MKQIVCEMCGSSDLMKHDGVFVCQHCGCKYSVEEAKKMMIEGAVDIQGTVKVDNTDELAHLYQIARRAKDANNTEQAAKYYDQILVKDSNSWEATFYSVFYSAMQCKVAEINTAATNVKAIIKPVLSLMSQQITENNEMKIAALELTSKTIVFASMLSTAAKNNNHDTYLHCNRMETIRSMLYSFGAELEKYKNRIGMEASAKAWKICVDMDGYLLENFANFGVLTTPAINKTYISSERDRLVSKIKEIDSSYSPYINSTSEALGGCYVATAVYGSYDCPQVWTLRRYRDYTLAETWYGRAFIHTYYAISPTLVKWFGHTNWFRNMWKPKLDKMVERLHSEGVEDTPYIDRRW